MLYLKLLGAMAVMAAAAVCAAALKKRFCDRARLLRAIERDAVHIKSALEYSSPTLEECFSGCNSLFNTAAAYIRRGSAPCEAMLESVRAQTLLNPDEVSAMENFAQNLCVEDIDGQAANFSLLIERARVLAAAAESESASKGRLCVAGSVCSALVCVIILL